MDPGLYVHIPFCKRRCGYCDFYVEVRSSSVRARTVEAILREARRRAASWADLTFGNVFFGGGTPSHLGPELLLKLTEGLRDALSISPEAEWTMEANPESASTEVLAAARAGGVNRVSLGAQSFHAGELTALNRLHGAEEIGDALARARSAGFENVNLDLIYGLPHSEPGALWEESLQRALALSPDHLSAYLLSLETHVPMGRDLASGRLVLPREGGARRQYDRARGVLAGAGFVHYEISNWSRPARQCRHNVNVWRGGIYLGLGPGAHGYDGRVRRANRADLDGYCVALEAGEDAPHTEDAIDERGRKEEWVFLGLRLREGLAWSELRKRLAPLEVDRLLDRTRAYAREGLLEDDGERVWISDEGIFVSNALIAGLLEAV